MCVPLNFDCEKLKTVWTKQPRTFVLSFVKRIFFIITFIKELCAVDFVSSLLAKIQINHEFSFFYAG